jgi:hypothetical protein
MIVCAVLFGPALSGCDGELYRLPKEELQRRIRKLPLEERYEFYLQHNLDSRPPKLWLMAPEVAELGEPAWRYAIVRGTTGDPFDLWNALPVLEAFNRKCTSADYAKLIHVARSERAIQEYEKLLEDRVKSMCRERNE